MLLAFCAATTQRVEKLLTFLGICYFTAFHNTMCLSAGQTYPWRHWEVEEPWDSQLGIFWSETLFRMSSEATQTWLFTTTLYSHRSNLRKGFWRLIYSHVPNASLIDCYLCKYYLEKNTMRFCLSYRLELQECKTQSLNYTSCLWQMKLPEIEIHWGLGGCSLGKTEYVSYLKIYDFFCLLVAVTFGPKNVSLFIQEKKSKSCSFFFFLRVFAHDTHTQNKFLQNKNGLFVFIFLAL